MIRVAKPNGIIAISLEYVTPMAADDIRAKHGYTVGTDERRIQTVEGLLAMFAPFVDNVYFAQDGYISSTPNTIKGSPAITVAVVFSIDKSKHL
jgi:hypothetical protein